NLMTWLLFVIVIVSFFFMFRTSLGLRLRSVWEHPRAAHTVGIDVYKVRYGAVILSGIIASLGGAYLAIGYTHSFTENMTNGRGFIGLAALIAGNWRPGGAFAFALLFGFFGGLAYRVQGYGYEYNVLVQALPYVITLIAVIGVIGRSVPPASVGRPYAQQRRRPAREPARLVVARLRAPFARRDPGRHRARARVGAGHARRVV